MVRARGGKDGDLIEARRQFLRAACGDPPDEFVMRKKPEIDFAARNAFIVL